MRSICVFCSSKEGLRREYEEAAVSLGKEIGRRGARLVYGGSKCGLMKKVADAVHAASGHTVGIVPQILSDRGLADDSDLVFYTADLSDRKAAMLRESDIFVALPGGLGTLDEIFTTAAANALGYHSKLTVLYNVCGFWDPLREMLRAMESERMLPSGMESKIKFASSPEELYSLIF